MHVCDRVCRCELWPFGGGPFCRRPQAAGWLKYPHQGLTMALQMAFCIAYLQLSAPLLPGIADLPRPLCRLGAKVHTKASVSEKRSHSQVDSHSSEDEV